MSELNGSDNIETKAREMGWKPLEEFKGNPDNWRDAEVFVERGEEILPIVRKDNEKLRAEVAQTKLETARLKALVDAGQEAIAELKAKQKQMQAANTQNLKEQDKSNFFAHLLGPTPVPTPRKEDKKEGENSKTSHTSAETEPAGT